MDEKLTKGKIEKSLEIICPLYRENLITEAYIVGSVATGNAREESDIDIIIINPDFIWGHAYISPLPIEESIISLLSEKEKRRESLTLKIIKKLNDIGVEFKAISRKGDLFWYQLYKGELFHMIPFNEAFHIINLPHIKIFKEVC